MNEEGDETRRPLLDHAAGDADSSVVDDHLIGATIRAGRRRRLIAIAAGGAAAILIAAILVSGEFHRSTSSSPIGWKCGRLVPPPEPDPELAVSADLPAEAIIGRRLEFTLTTTNSADGLVRGNARPVAWIAREGRVVGGRRLTLEESKAVDLAPGESASQEFALTFGRCSSRGSTVPLPLRPGHYQVYVGQQVGDAHGMSEPIDLVLTQVPDSG